LSLPNPTSPPKTWTKTADRPLRSRRQSLGIWLFAHWLGVPVPWHAVRQTDARGLLAFEHERLLALAAAGEAVPPVIAFDGHSLVTGDIGRILAHTLGEVPEPQRLAIMCAASADLAAFHARGHWHGGAQTRNITWDGERFARLDFEEPLLPGTALRRAAVAVFAFAHARTAGPRCGPRGAAGLRRRSPFAHLRSRSAAESGGFFGTLVAQAALGVAGGGMVEPAESIARTQTAAHRARGHGGVCGHRLKQATLQSL
jgi:hypothetical protein